MVYDINGKVALITGGASGIGFNYARELLKNGLQVNVLQCLFVDRKFLLAIKQNLDVNFHYRNYNCVC